MNCSNALNSVLYTVEHTVVKRLEGLRLAKRYVLINEPVKLNFLYDGMISDSQLRFGTINVTDLVIKEKSIEAGIFNGNICTVFFLAWEDIGRLLFLPLALELLVKLES